MITGIAGFLLNAFSIILLSAVIIIVLISVLLTTGLWQGLRLSAEDRLFALWLLVLSPWLIGAAATAVVVLLSQPAISSLFGNTLVHWHHLDEFALNSWHGYLVMITLALAVTLLVRVTGKLVRANNMARLMGDFATSRSDGVLELDSETCAAFTAGVSQPRCYMTRALIAQLNAEEYEVIRLHELNHVERRDPARKARFQILAGFFPALVARVLNGQLTMATEQIADTRVTATVPDKAVIARALLKVKRLGGASTNLDETGFACCHFGNDAIDQRIRYLLSDGETDPLSLITVIALMLALAAGCALAADTVHHAIELSLIHTY